MKDYIVGLCFVLTLGSCAQPDPLGPLPDGLYLVVEDGQALATADHPVTVIPFDTDLYADASDLPDELSILTEDHVPLHLARSPEIQPQADRKANLLLQLDQVNTGRLQEFTARHLGEVAAIVIDGRAVTKHRIKAAIEGGRLQITWCGAYACEQLRLSLEDNVDP